MKRVQKGSVLLQVMILGIIVAFLAAGMAAMLLSRSGSTARIEQGNAAARYDGAGLDVLINAWNANGICTNDATGIYSCSPFQRCSCTCSLTSSTYWATMPTVVVSGAGAWPACQSSVAANFKTN